MRQRRRRAISPRRSGNLCQTMIASASRISSVKSASLLQANGSDVRHVANHRNARTGVAFQFAESARRLHPGEMAILRHGRIVPGEKQIARRLRAIFCRIKISYTEFAFRPA